MKKVKKEIELNFESVSMNVHGDLGTTEYNYQIRNREPIDLETLKCFVTVEEPETIKEFLEVNKLPKKELIKWLNKNYNK